MRPIDDFGTGYSSLVQLQKMPFSEVKVDLSFVTQMMSNAGCGVIVEIVIDLAHKLGLKCVAEGVQEQAALESLIDLGLRCGAGILHKPADRSSSDAAIRARL